MARRRRCNCLDVVRMAQLPLELRKQFPLVWGRYIESIIIMDQSYPSQESRLSSHPTCLPEDAAPALALHIYANLSRNSEVLLGESLELRRTATISEPTAIYVHHEKARTKLLTLSLPASPVLVDEEGYRLMAEIYPVLDESGQTRFHIQRPNLGVADLSRPEENTFVSLRKAEGERRADLRDDDVLKMGRESYRVRVVRKNELAIKPSWHETIPHLDSQQTSCRICLSEEMTHERDYLVSPCRCAGSCASTHLECLRLWMRSRLQLRATNHVKTYNFRLFTCEICKARLPRFVRVGGEVLPLLPMSMESHYVAFERVGDDPVLHMVETKDIAELQIGRNDKYEFYLEEMSISRNHARLFFRKNRVEVEDSGSKFGTFLLLRRRLPLRREVNMYCGRWMFRISADSQ